jgi:hypothetical protein
MRPDKGHYTENEKAQINPLWLNGNTLSQQFKYPHGRMGKTLSLNDTLFLKLSASIITHLFFTVLVEKACVGMKDCVKFHFSSNYH